MGWQSPAATHDTVRKKGRQVTRRLICIGPKTLKAFLSSASLTMQDSETHSEAVHVEQMRTAGKDERSQTVDMSRGERTATAGEEMHLCMVGGCQEALEQ